MGESTQWTGLWARYAAWTFCTSWRRRLDARLFEEIFRELDPGETVLDLGAGTGYLSLAVAERVPRGKVIALDLSEQMVDQLRRRASRLGLADRVQILVADAARTGLDDGCVDRVVSSNVLHEVPDQAAFLGEARRVLRPGGRLVLRDFRNGVIGALIRIAHGRTASGPRAPEELERLLLAAGFAEQRVTPVGQQMIGVALC